jgi:hypothetical protein
LSKDDKETILDAIKEKTTWLEENPEAEAEDYEDQLSELQSTVGVSLFSFSQQVSTDNTAYHCQALQLWR